MGYRMRYFITDHKEPIFKLKMLEEGLQLMNAGYSIEYRGEDGDAEYGLLLYQGGECGPIEVNWSGIIFESELEEFRQEVMESNSPHRKRVLEVINETRSLFVMQVLLGKGENIEETYRRIDPIFEWLTRNRSGLTHADLEGFYDGADFLLETER